MISDFKSLIELIKSVLPFIVCVITFIFALILYKKVLKTHRKNPLIYILSVISVTALYFTFIDVFGLGRNDYFLDGLRLFLRQFNGIITNAILIFLTILTVIKTIDIPILVYGILSLASIVSIFTKNIHYLVLKAKYIFALVFNFRFKVLNHIKLYFVYNFKAIDNLHILNCVFNC